MLRTITLEIKSEKNHEQIVNALLGYFKHFCTLAGAVAGKDFSARILVDGEVKREHNNGSAS
jgi:hypothetical protein